ncbi:MAG: sulfatase [Saprospiraceae bacterium]|nr:sulfatase [Saprospiraceae bacterium]
MRQLHLLFVFGLTLGLANCTEKVEERPPNLLFIAIDDLRPELGCYGNKVIKSPHLDRLADRSTLYAQHYVTSPTCGASRYALLTGKRPTARSHIRNSALYQHLSTAPEEDAPESFFHHLRRNGYYTAGIGKIPHSIDNRVYGYTDPMSDSLEMPYSWDEFYHDYHKWGTGWDAFFGYADGTNRQGQQKQVYPYESANVSDDAYPDGQIAAAAIETLQRLAQSSQPFALATGFFKPHLPWTAPQRYWDLYDSSELSLTPMPDYPSGASLASLHNSGEFNNYQLGEERASLSTPLSSAYQRKLTHAYYACVSYVDRQVGKVLEELERLGLEENTLVVLWSDHGWHLGDYRVWGKHTLFEHALHSVLMIREPGQSAAVVDQNIASTVDVYPTIMQHLSIEPPVGLDGRVLNAPIETDLPARAYSYFREGISMRTAQYRYTRYFREDIPVELYDHRTTGLEVSNLAGKDPDLEARLSTWWEEGNTGLFD